jgi:hypothetical protein
MRARGYEEAAGSRSLTEYVTVIPNVSTKSATDTSDRTLHLHP